MTAPPKALACPQRLVSVGRASAGSRPKIGILARWNHRLCPSLGNRIKTVSRVICAICADAGYGLTGRNLSQQLWQHGRVPTSVAGDLDGPYLQRLCVNAEVNLGTVRDGTQLRASCACIRLRPRT